MRRPKFPGFGPVGSYDIWYLDPFHLPSRHAQAIQIVHTCRALAEAGRRVLLLVKRNPCHPVSTTAEALAWYGVHPHESLRIAWLPTAHNGLSGLTARWWIRHAQGAPLFYARHLRLAVTAARRHRGLVIAELHRVKEGLDRTLPWLDGIVTVTTPLRNRIHDLFAPAVPVEVIPDAADPAVFTPPTAPGAPRLIYTGHLHREKGVDLIVRALAGLPDVTAMIVGGERGEDPDRRHLQKLADELGVYQQIEWVSHVPQTEISSRLRAADIAVLPTRSDEVRSISASPLKLFEYMTCGLAVLATDLPAIRDVIRSGANGLLFPDGDVGGLVAAARQLVDEPALRKALGNQARSEAACYTWEQRARRILTFADRVEEAKAASLASRGRAN